MLYQIYNKYWKLLILIPLAILVASLAILAMSMVTQGHFLERDIELTGGKRIEISTTNANIAEIKDMFPFAAVRLTSAGLLIVDIPFDVDENDIVDGLGSLGITGPMSLRTVGPAIGELFFQQAQLALVIAFILMSFMIFVLFRSVVPSLIVVLAAVTDIVGTLGVLNILGINFSLHVLAALLMLIGYSVDTDVLLTYEMVKGTQKSTQEKIITAGKTGLTMTITTLVALTAVSMVAGSVVLEEIALVLIIGLIIDIPATWLANVGILRIWIERREKA